MKPKPYTDEEIVEKLADGRLAATDIEAALRIASHHSQAIQEQHMLFRGTNPPLKRRERGDLDDYFSENRRSSCVGFSITIPLPPKRRALRREELPEQFCTVSGGTLLETYFREDARVNPDQIQLWIDLDATWLNEGGKGVFYIDEPQEPLVITTEGAI